jgi:hypothetical protein
MPRVFLISFLIFIFSIPGNTRRLLTWPGAFMTMDEISKRWGENKFDVSKFKNGSENERASMIYDLIKNHQREFIGKDTAEVRKILGSFSGYYFSDLYPTYIIYEATDKREAWQLVFLLDMKQKVDEIAVHKNCCN